MTQIKNQMNLSWHDHAACKGQNDIFFGPYNERTVAKEKRETVARSICVRCPVLDQCRQHARTFPEYGFWGGESEEERSAGGFKVSNPVIKRRIRTLNKQNQIS
jgi:WhiB family transcriptional regulator, redox-sensing transcriptional regulator